MSLQPQPFDLIGQAAKGTLVFTGTHSMPWPLPWLAAAEALCGLFFWARGEELACVGTQPL